MLRLLTPTNLRGLYFAFCHICGPFLLLLLRGQNSRGIVSCPFGRPIHMRSEFGLGLKVPLQLEEGFTLVLEVLEILLVL